MEVLVDEDVEEDVDVEVEVEVEVEVVVVVTGGTGAKDTTAIEPPPESAVTPSAYEPVGVFAALLSIKNIS